MKNHLRVVFCFSADTIKTANALPAKTAHKDIPMLKKLLVTTGCALLIASCAQSPTGRTQIMLFSDAQLSKMGEQTFDAMKAEIPLSKDVKTNNYVRCVSNSLRAELGNCGV
jgi:hypothetical protein